MDAYFGARGDAGRRMMRQTAAVQLNIDAWHDPLLTWRALNALAPCVLALSANSSRYAGRDTGCASYRAATWRELDPSRTGLLGTAEDAASEYARFALAAGPMVDHPFSAGWRDHLSTLFPEVRPRGWFELRTADALPPERYTSVVLPIALIVQDATALHETMDALGVASPDLLERAGRHGLADFQLRRLSGELLDIAARAALRSRSSDADAEVLTEMRGRLAG
jgi:glutamate--cysteine ligase